MAQPAPVTVDEFRAPMQTGAPTVIARLVCVEPPPWRPGTLEHLRDAEWLSDWAVTGA